MTRDALVRRIQELALRRGGLLRVHLTHPHIYARARRQFGSWAAAIEAAGLSYAETVTRARERSLETRRRVRRRARHSD